MEIITECWKRHVLPTKIIEIIPKRKWRKVISILAIVMVLHSCAFLWWNNVTYDLKGHVLDKENSFNRKVVENNNSFSGEERLSNLSAIVSNPSFHGDQLPEKVNESSISKNNIANNHSSAAWPKVSIGCEEQGCQSHNHALAFNWPKIPSDDPLTCDNLLLQLLHDDPEHNAFPDITIQTSQHADECFFPGLDEELLSSAYRHRRIAFLGDSTLRILTRYLYALLETDGIDRFPLFTLEEGNVNVRHTADKKLGIKLGKRVRVMPITNDEGMHIEYNGIYGSRGKAEVELLEESWNHTLAMKPDVLVVNMGMHWMHIYGFGRSPTYNQIINWIEYEKWLQLCVDNAVSNGIKLLVFKKTNLICEGDYFGQYAKGLAKYQSNDPVTLQECKQWCKTALQEANFTASDPMISTYCTSGLMAGSGAEYLNRRLLRFVKNLPTYPNLNVTVLDDSSVQSCNYTIDGRHFNKLNLLRIRVLGNQIQSFLRNTPEFHVIGESQDTR